MAKATTTKRGKAAGKAARKPTPTPARAAVHTGGRARTAAQPAGSKGQRNAVVRHMAEVLWENPPAHSPGALSKMLVRPETAGSELIDFRISTYQPMSYVEPHAHKVQEQIYHVLSGEGLMELGSDRRVVRPGEFIFIPPGVRHAIYNTGQGDLTFFVITTPPEDE